MIFVINSCVKKLENLIICTGKAGSSKTIFAKTMSHALGIGYEKLDDILYEIANGTEMREYFSYYGKLY